MGADRPTVILTRPERASRRFAELLDSVLEGRAVILIAPVLEIVPVALRGDLPPYQTLIFTSENAVDSFARQNQDPRGLAYCVGDRTAAAAETAGYRAISASGDAAALKARLLADMPPGPWLHPGGAVRSTDLADELTRAGHSTVAVVTYRQEARPLGTAAEAALLRGPVILPVFSPRSAAFLSGALPDGAVPPHVVAISRAAADSWAAPARTLRIAPSPDAPSMAATIRAELNRDSAC